jgi:hypothetical protein
LPEPDSPTIPTQAPRGTEKLTSLSAAISAPPPVDEPKADPAPPPVKVAPPPAVKAAAAAAPKLEAAPPSPSEAPSSPARRAAKPKTGTVRFSKASGDVYVDGVRLGASPATVTCGKHWVKVGSAVGRTVDVPCGGATSL